MSNSKFVAVSRDHMPILRSMLIAQNKYIQANTKDKKFIKAFTDNMSNFIAEANACSDYTYFKMYFFLTKEKLLNKETSIFDFIFRSSKREGLIFSLELIESSIVSIDTRFVDGGFRLHEGLLKLKSIKIK